MKVAIAAKFNHTVPYGWPVLQVWRQNDSTSVNGSFYAVNITQREPKPTGYLNVFECDTSDKEFVVHPGEQVHISWFPFPSYPARYSLAYDERGAMAIGFTRDIQSITTMSMISGSGQSIPTVNSTQSGMITSSSKRQTSTLTTEVDVTVQSKQPDALEATTAIVGGVLCTIMLIVLLTVLAIAVFVVFRCRNHTKNKFSPNGNDLSASVLPVSSTPIIQNPTYSLVDSEFQTINYCKDRGIVNLIIYVGSPLDNGSHGINTSDNVIPLNLATAQSNPHAQEVCEFTLTIFVEQCESAN